MKKKEKVKAKKLKNNPSSGKKSTKKFIFCEFCETQNSILKDKKYHADGKCESKLLAKRHKDIGRLLKNMKNFCQIKPKQHDLLIELEEKSNAELIKIQKFLDNILAERNEDSRLKRCGETNSFYGKVHSEESKKMIGDRSYEKNSVKILVNNILYKSISDATRKLNLPRGTLDRLLISSKQSKTHKIFSILKIYSDTKCDDFQKEETLLPSE